MLIIPAFYGAKLLVTQTPFQSVFSAEAVPSHQSPTGQFQALAIIIWTLIFPILVYIPFNLQRRLVVGVQVPLVILATVGLFSLYKKLLGARQQAFAQGGVLLFFSLTNVLLLAGSFINLAGQYPPMFQPGAHLEAIRWLANQTQGEVVLAAHESGNLLPAYANVRTFLGHGPETVHAKTKQGQIRTFFDQTTADTWRIDLLRQFNIRYLYYGPNEKALGDFVPEQAEYLQKVYDREEVQVFRVSGAILSE